MKIDLKCFSSLADMESCRYDKASTISLSEEATARDLARRANINEKDIHTVFVNNRRSELDHSLSDGDRVAFVPAVGGM
jgi:molybdopterin converting factor small subunit